MSVSDWLRSETPKHLTLLSKLRERLETSLLTDEATDEDGVSTGVPSRDWCRAAKTYQTGYQAMLVEERERAKLSVMARRLGNQPLTDEEYEREMRQLGLDAIKELPTAELAREFLARGMAMPVGYEPPPEEQD